MESVNLNLKIGMKLLLLCPILLLCQLHLTFLSQSIGHFTISRSSISPSNGMGASRAPKMVTHVVFPSQPRGGGFLRTLSPLLLIFLLMIDRFLCSAGLPSRKQASSDYVHKINVPIRAGLVPLCPTCWVLWVIIVWKRL